MKKFIAMLVCFVVFFNVGIAAFAGGSNMVWQMSDNFTSDSTLTFTFQNNDDIRALLEEVFNTENLTPAFPYITSFLTSLFTYDGNIRIQTDVSHDLQKIKLGLTVENNIESIVSPNLNYAVNSKAGMWINIDLTDTDNPVCNLTFMHPAGIKYYHIDASKYLDEEIISTIKSFLNREKIDEINKTVNEMMLKYAKSKSSSNSFSYVLDNAGMVAYLNEYFDYSLKLNAQMADEDIEIDDISIPDGMQILGKDGIECYYTLSNGVVTKVETKADICVDISQIYTSVSGEEWPYCASGIIEFKLTEKDIFSKLGTTKVEYPELTEENCVNLNERIDKYNSYEGSYYEEYVPEYPHFHVYVCCDALPVIDGDIYVPLRASLETAYEHTVTIDYSSGVVTAVSDKFNGFNTLSVTMGDNCAYLDGNATPIGEVININGSTYVNSSLFTRVFGWELGYAAHDMLSNAYEYTFYTDVP